jgi:hypothetical protein
MADHGQARSDVKLLKPITSAVGEAPYKTFVPTNVDDPQAGYMLITMIYLQALV